MAWGLTLGGLHVAGDGAASLRCHGEARRDGYSEDDIIITDVGDDEEKLGFGGGCGSLLLTQAAFVSLHSRRKAAINVSDQSQDRETNVFDQEERNRNEHPWTSNPAP